MRNKIYLLLGILFILMGFGLVLYNISLDKKADKKSEQVLSRLDIRTDSSKKIPEKERPAQIPTKEIDGVEFIGMLDLGRLDKKLPVVARWDYEIIKAYPARYKGETYEDPLIILAHNYGSQFGDLSKLQEGDRISFTDVYGRKMDYEVEVLEVLDGTDIENMVQTDYDLTLFTCTLDGSQRITLRAKKL